MIGLTEEAIDVFQSGSALEFVVFIFTMLFYLAWLRKEYPNASLTRAVLQYVSSVASSSFTAREVMVRVALFPLYILEWFLGDLERFMAFVISLLGASIVQCVYAETLHMLEPFLTGIDPLINELYSCCSALFSLGIYYELPWLF